MYTNHVVAPLALAAAPCILGVKWLSARIADDELLRELAKQFTVPVLWCRDDDIPVGCPSLYLFSNADIPHDALRRDRGSVVAELASSAPPLVKIAFFFPPQGQHVRVFRNVTYGGSKVNAEIIAAIAEELKHGLAVG
jgi:hypothetical protein